jgi:hypothetical protein
MLKRDCYAHTMIISQAECNSMAEKLCVCDYLPASFFQGRQSGSSLIFLSRGGIIPHEQQNISQGELVLTAFGSARCEQMLRLTATEVGILCCKRVATVHPACM